MFSTILLPVDLGHDASWEKALPAALGFGGALHLLSVAPDFGESAVSSYFPPDFEAKARAGLKARLEAFAAEKAPGATAHVAFGDIDRSILDAASRIGADLIVMASHKPNELRSFFVGSHAERVVRHAPIPVLVIR